MHVYVYLNNPQKHSHHVNIRNKNYNKGSTVISVISQLF